MDYKQHKNEDFSLDMGDSTIEPGVHQIKVAEESEFHGVDRDGNPVIKVELSFIFPKGSARVKEWYIISSANSKAVNVGVSKLDGLLQAAGLPRFSETWVTDGLVGKIVMCNVVYKEGTTYLRIDDDYGKNYKPVPKEQEVKAEVKEQETVSAKADTDAIPF